MNNQIRLAGLIFVGMFLMFGLGTVPSQAASFSVADEASLVAAINSANANADFDIIELTADINLATTTTYNFNGATGLPIITKPLAIRGNGHTIRRTSATQFRLLAANATQLWLEDLTLAGGDINGSGGAILFSGAAAKLTLLNVTVGGSESNGNRALINGGGIYADGELIITNSNISYNQLTATVGTIIGAGIYKTSAADLRIVNSTISYNNIPNAGARAEGVGIGVYGGNFYLIDSLVTYNSSVTTVYGIGVYIYTASSNPSEQAYVFGSQVNHNFANTSASYYGSGGGMISYYRYNYIRYSDFSYNNITASGVSAIGAAFSGGEIYYSNFSNNTGVGTTTIGSATIGGLSAQGMYILGTTISNNTIVSNHSGTTAYSGPAGAYLTRSTIESSTISGNSMTHNGSFYSSLGGGVYVYGFTNINNVTITNNNIKPALVGGGIMFGPSWGPDSSYYLANNIISDNYNISNTGVTAASNCGKEGGSPAAIVISYGFNAIEGSCFFSPSNPTDIFGTVTLNALANNGGFNFTHAISTTPPINSGNPASTGNGVCATTDQRGAPRVGQCDIGAYEAGATLPPANQAPLPSNDLYATASNTSLSESLAWNDTDPDSDSLTYHLLTLPSHGSASVTTAGIFTYNPMTGYSGNDSFNYLACDNKGDCSTATVSIAIDAITGFPSAPTLSLASVDSFLVNLTWLDNSSDESAFVIQRRPSGGTWSTVGNVGADVLLFADTTASCAFPYEYRLRAYRAADGAYSQASNIVTATTSACPPPPNFTGEGTGYGSLTLSWEDNLFDESRYHVEISSNGGASWGLSGNESANSTSHTRTSLTCGTTYQFRVRSERDTPAMVSAYSPAITVSTNACPPLPNAPTNLVGNATGYTSIALTWADNASDEAGYQVQRSTDGGTTFTNLTTAGANQTTYSNINLSCGTSYQYKVRTYRTNPVVQYSDFSNTVTVTTNACPPEPNAPTSLTALGTSYTAVQLNWVDSNSDESNYYIERSLDAGLTWSALYTAAANSTSYNNTGLTCGTSYQYRIRAYRSTPQALYSVYSDVATGTTTACPPLPNTPSALTAVSSGVSSISLNWTDTNSDEASYYMERSSDGGTNWSQIGAVAANVTTYNNTGLNCNTSYQYRLRTYRVNPVPQYSVYSDVVSATTDACPPLPDAPTALTATAISANSIELSWADNSSTEAGFVIERSPNGTSSWTSLTTTAANTTTYISSSLSCNTIYYYRVKATNITGVSAYSNIANATTLGCPPNAPSGLSGTAMGKTTVSLTWTDNASNETAYYLERSLDAGLTWTVLNPLAANTTSFGDTGLSCGTNYRYRLRAYRADANAYSSYSSTASVTTQACTTILAPTNIVSDPMTSTRLDIRWTDKATNETAYRIQRSNDGGNTWTTLADLAANSTSYSDTSLSCNQYYRYRVAAYYAPENSYSTWLTSINTGVQCAPTNVALVAASFGSLKLSWDAPGLFTNQVLLERSANGGASWTLVGNVNFGSLDKFTDTGLACGTTYQYRLRFFDSGSDYSDYSAVFIATTSACIGITEATCSMEQFDTSAQTVNMTGPIYLSGDASRFAINTSQTSIQVNGLLIYELATENLLATIPNATVADMDYDGSHLVFLSTGNPTGNNADGNEEVFLWNNGTFTQLTNTTGESNFFQPKISDDGTIIVFKGDGAVVGESPSTSYVYIWDATNGLRKLISTSGAVGEVAISGDGTSVAFLHTAQLTAQNLSSSMGLYIWDAANGSRLITSVFQTGFFIYSLSINTDGSRLSFGAGEGPFDWNPDYSLEFFLWDETEGLKQMTEGASSDSAWPIAMDASGNRVLLTTNLDLDSDSTNPVTAGYYLFDAGYGYSQFIANDNIAWPTFGSAVSADGLTLALVYPMNWNGVAEVYPYLEVMLFTCTPANYLPAPANLALSLNGTDAIDLTWVDNSLGETGYRIERSEDSGATWTEIAQTPANSTSYSDADLGCALNYQYRLRGYRGGDNHFSDYSNVDTAPATADCLPAKPTALTVSEITETAISLAWTDNASDESEYRLERSTDNGTTWTEIAQPVADSTTYADASILCNLDYKYRLRAYRAGDDVYSHYSNLVSAASLDCPPPLAPTALSVTDTSETSVSLAWTDNASDESAYRIERSADAGTTWTEVAQAAVDSTSYADNTAVCSASYDYRIRVYRAADNQFSAYSNVVTATTDTCPPPAAPTALSMSANSLTSISLSWTDNAISETAYRLERSSDGGATWTEVAQLPADSTSYENTGLNCSTNYDYRIRAYRIQTDAFSSYSNILNAATKLCLPIAPTALNTSSQSMTSIDLTWADNANDETGYRVERSNNGGTSWTEIAMLAADATSFSNSGLSCSTNYSYRIRAYRSGDNAFSDYSNTLNTSTALCLPDTPTSLSLSSKTQTSINLAWIDNASNETAYRVERSDDAGATWTEIAQIAANSTSYSNTGLSCATSYQYRLRAYRSGDNQYSAYSNVLSATTNLCTLQAPTALSITGTSETSINLSWTDNTSDETSYRVERSSNGGTSWTEIVQLAADSTSYSNTGLTCATSYTYRVRVYRSVDNQYSAYSTAVNGSTLICPPPLAPTSLSVSSKTQTVINLAWVDNATNETGYRVERSDDAGVTWTEIAQIAANSSSYSNTGRSCGTTYQYRLRAYRSGDAQYSDFSNVLSVTTDLCAAPSTPTSLSSPSRTASSINLSWLDNASNETGYRVERSDDAGVTWTEIAQIAANSTSYSNTALTCATSYRYRVRAYRSGDGQYSSYSNVLTVSTMLCPPPAPDNLSITSSTTTSITLSWTDNASDETGYRVERSSDAGTSWTQIISLAANVTSYNNTSLTCATSYQYRVRAYRSTDAQYSAYSAVTSGATLLCPPPNAPISLTSPSRTVSSINLSWLDNASNETDYRVERSDDAGATWTEIAQLAANSTNYSNTGLSCGTSYRYRVRAYRSGDNLYSSYSSVLSIATTACPPPNAPTALSSLLVSGRHISMSWTDNASDENSYRVERSSDAGTSWTELAQLPVNSTSYDNTGLNCGISYQYRVRVWRSWDSQYSAYSNTLSIATTACSLAPNGLTSTAITTNSISLLWADNSTDESQYRLERSADSGTSWTEIAQLPADSTSYSDAGLLCFRTYLYRVRAYRDSDNQYSSYSSSLTVKTSSCPVLASPTNTVITDRQATSISLQWLDNALGETDYYVFRRFGTENAIVLAILPADSTGYVDTTVECTKSYTYYIYAHQLGGNNTFSLDTSGSRVTATTLDCPGLERPTNVQTSRTSFTMTFSWTDNASIETAYYVETSAYGSDPWIVVGILPANSSSFTETVACSTPHAYRVRAYDAVSGNYSPYSSYVGANSAYCPPTNFQASNVTASSVQLTWTNNTTFANFNHIERSIAGANTWTRIAELAVTASSYTDTSVNCNTSYDYRVFAINSAYSFKSDYATLTLTTAVCPAPTAPSGLSSTAISQTSISLAWTDNASNETAYHIERSDDGITWTEITQVAANSTSYSNSALSCNTTYDYRVRAYRSGDNQFSAYSNVISRTTSTCPPPTAPTGLNLTGTTATSISLAWTDNASDESNYALERSSNSGTNWTEIALLASNSTSYSDSSALCNTSYQYRVRAWRSGDNQFSSYSNLAMGTSSVCPPPTAPTALSVASLGHTNINLGWTDNATNETGYRLERSSNGGTSWTEIAQLATNATSYNDATAVCNTSYDYRIRAYRLSDNQFSDYSNVVTGTTDICITLNAPTAIQLTASTETSLTLSWADNSSNESGYEIERSLNGTNWTVLSSLPANSTSYSDGGLTCSAGYYYRLRSNHLGTATYSPYGNSGLLTTVSCPALVASVLSSTGSSASSISLSWTVDSSATSYTLAYYNGSSWLNLGIFPSTTTNYTHNGLACNMSYQYQVTTFRVADSASVTSSAFSTSTSACPPLAAANSPIVINTEPALVSLQIPAMPATATSMSLERSSDSITWMSLGTVSGNYLDTAVVCGSSYQYRLVATRSSDGMTSTSATAVALTDACPIPNVVGVYRAGMWVFVDSNNTATPVNSFNFGGNQWQPLVGDWDGDGVDGVGLYQNGEFALRNIASADSPENRFNFGTAEAGWQAIVGDWNGDGRDTVGLYKDGLFTLSDDNINIQYRFNFGYQQTAWQAIAGDWDGNGADGIGLYKEGLWLLANDLNNPDASSQNINYGPTQAGLQAIVGDWNGDGIDSIGLYINGIWRMRVNSVNDSTETSINFGQTGDIPLAILKD